MDDCSPGGLTLAEVFRVLMQNEVTSMSSMNSNQGFRSCHIPCHVFTALRSPWFLFSCLPEETFNCNAADSHFQNFQIFWISIGRSTNKKYLINYS